MQPAINALSRVIENDLLNEKSAAQFLEVEPGTFSVWRCTGRYKIPFIKVGRLVRYRQSDLDAWLESRTRVNGATE
jgi:excisionase family DNA binding protein